MKITFGIPGGCSEDNAATGHQPMDSLLCGRRIGWGGFERRVMLWPLHSFARKPATG